MKIFRGVYSRENVPAKIAKKKCGSINLETEICIHIGSVTEIQKIFVNILIYSV